MQRRLCFFLELVCAVLAIQYDGDRKESSTSSEEFISGRFPLLMPNVTAKRSELYVCTPVKIDDAHTYFITGFQPNASMNTAHHMLLYGCGTPGSEKAIWNCGEMAESSSSDDMEVQGPCGSKSQVIYAWARDAPDLNLPEGVGFKVGKNSMIKYLVLQVHYAHKKYEPDDSGVFLKYTTEPKNKLAGVFLLGTGGIIKPHSTEHMETACRIEENKLLHPFAYRTHTHSLGKVVAGYRVRSNDRGEQSWLQLGKRDPLTPQMFYPVDNNGTIERGDTLAARCTMVSDRDRITYTGATAGDEMCNFYLMYFVENDEPLKMKYCYSRGPPMYYWDTPETELNSIPDIEASKL